MAEQIGSDVDVDDRQAKSAAKSAGTDPAMLAAIGSVLLSLYIYYVSGNRQQGIFVGLWAPTFLAFASYLTQKDIDDQVSRAV